MTAVMLPPCQLAVEHAHVHRGHLLLAVIIGSAEILRAQQPEHRPCGYGSHVTALMIEPLRIAFFGNAITDEGQPRSTQGDELMGVDRDIAGVPGAKSVALQDAKTFLLLGGAAEIRLWQDPEAAGAR